VSKIEYALVNIIDSRKAAASKQSESGATDTGRRSEVTGGGHLDAVTDVISNTFIDAGIPREWIFSERTNLELPGYFRAEKKWFADCIAALMPASQSM